MTSLSSHLDDCMIWHVIASQLKPISLAAALDFVGGGFVNLELGRLDGDRLDGGMTLGAVGDD